MESWSRPKFIKIIRFQNCRSYLCLSNAFCTLLYLLISGLIIVNVSACSSSKNLAPVSPHSRDLVNGEKYYVVKQGDTLYSIGFRSSIGYRRLSEWNKIKSPYKIMVGQKIKLFQPKQKLSVKKSGKNKNITADTKRKVNKKSSIISKDNKKMLKFYWQWPLKGKILKNFTQTGSKGIDIYGKKGQKVKAAESGKVVYSGSGLTGYGNLLIIKHNYLYLSAYANNSRLLVKEGQTVKKGQVIAEVGRANNRQTSLHFEIRKNGIPVNPLLYLPK